MSSLPPQKKQATILIYILPQVLTLVLYVVLFLSMRIVLLFRVLFQMAVGCWRQRSSETFQKGKHTLIMPLIITKAKANGILHQQYFIPINHLLSILLCTGSLNAV